MEFRKSELILKKNIWITEEIYKILKEQKKIQKKSMARIVNDLILKNYEKRKND